MSTGPSADRARVTELCRRIRDDLHECAALSNRIATEAQIAEDYPATDACYLAERAFTNAVYAVQIAEDVLPE